jgi:transcriptional regulator with XRE-family HTH domain
MLATSTRIQTMATVDEEPQHAGISKHGKSGRDTRRDQSREVDRHIGTQIRKRRNETGLSLQTISDLVGVTYQQLSKYEKGVDRISSGRLFLLAQILKVDVGYFYLNLGDLPVASTSITPQSETVEPMRNFLAIPSCRQQRAICYLVNILRHIESTTSVR